MKLSKKLAFLSGLLFAVSCSSEKKDEPKNKDTSGEEDEDSVNTAGSLEIAALASAFPEDLEIGTQLIEGSDAKATTAGTVATSLTNDGVLEIDRPIPSAEKRRVIAEILNAKEISSCFRFVRASFPQPECFSPNIEASDISGAASSDNPYIITMDSNGRALYGDTGIVQRNEGKSSCAAETIAYFTEDAIQYIEKAKQIFASLVCVSKFTDIKLPKNGESINYLSSLGKVHLPPKFEFTTANISASGSGDNLIYETKLGIKTSSTSNFFTVFRHNEGSNKGHVVAVQTGVGDQLIEANNLLLQNNPPNGPENPDPNQPGQSGGSTTTTVSVIYDLPTEDEKTPKKVELYKGAFKGTNNPATYISSDGSFDFEKIANELGTGNNGADNFVYTKFHASVDGSNPLNEGTTLWTASISDQFWRAFAFNINGDDDGQQTLKATFGFNEFKNQSSNYVTPDAPVGMFCSWAQGFGPPLMLSSDNLQGSDLSGPVFDAVQFDVSIREKDSKYFEHQKDQSGLEYRVAANDCGTAGTENKLQIVDSKGGISGKFTPPSVDNVSPLGGLKINPNDIDL